MEKGNNKTIYTLLNDMVSFAGEQIESENVLSWQKIDIYKKEFLHHLEQRLKDGAKKYEEQVPIFSWQKAKTERDNLNEALEEYTDALVYQVAEMLSVEEYNIDQIQTEYDILVKRSMSHLIYAYLLLRKARDERDELEINNLKERTHE